MMEEDAYLFGYFRTEVSAGIGYEYRVGQTRSGHFTGPSGIDITLARPIPTCEAKSKLPLPLKM